MAIIAITTLTITVTVTVTVTVRKHLTDDKRDIQVLTPHTVRTDANHTPVTSRTERNTDINDDTDALSNQ